MATKSRNDRTLFWSLIALVIAAGSIGYCFTHILELFNEPNRAIAQLTRLIKGGA